MTCHFCGRPVRRSQLNQHHTAPRSEGGQEVQPAHAGCHVRHHSQRGDFKRWGQLGGLKTACLGVWQLNLKYGAMAPPCRMV